MKGHKFNSGCYFFGIALLFLLKPNAINAGFDERGMAYYPSLYFKVFPNYNSTWNTLMAPLSARYSIAAGSLLSKRATKYEIEEVIGLKAEQLRNRLNNLRDENGWKIKLYVNKDKEVTPCIKKMAHGFIEYIHYNQFKYYTDRWVANRTNNIVKASMDRYYSRDTLASAVYVEYLDARWLKPFKNTVAARTRVNGNPLRSAMVQQDDTFLYGNWSDLGVLAVVLPLDNNANMLVMQPTDTAHLTENFEHLKNKLQGQDIRKLLKRSLRKTKLSLYFPILTDVYARRRVAQEVQQTGIKLPFTDKADFAKVSECGEPVHMSAIDQSSLINTDLEKVTIGTATNTIFEFTKNPPQLRSYERGADTDGEQADEPYVDVKTVIKVKVDESLQKLVLERFFFAIVSNDKTLFMGTIIKFHNNPDPGFAYTY